MGVNSQCGGKECVVSCSDGQGEKVALTCDSGLVDVKASSGDAAIVEVRCGTAAKEVDQGKHLRRKKLFPERRGRATIRYLEEKDSRMCTTPLDYLGMFSNAREESATS